jgi:hypothetical protein
MKILPRFKIQYPMKNRDEDAGLNTTRICLFRHFISVYRQTSAK